MDIKGKKIVLTGKFSEVDRKEAENQLKAMGASCSGSVSAKTDILFAGEKAGSKLATASKLGVAVFGESDLMALLGLTEPELELSDDTDILQLLADGKAQWVNNTPHKTDVVTYGMSHSGEYFATGAWCGDDYDAGGSLAIWETATGRCVNTIPYVEGGAGWPDYPGCIQWSHDDRRVGLAFNTNGVGYVDPFGNAHEVQNFVYATDGLSRPPSWCWAPDSARVFISCWGWKESSLPGCIGAPSAYESNAVYMAMTGDEGTDVEGVSPLTEMVWGADGIVTGYTRYGSAYAIDTNKRTLVWSVPVPGPVAIRPDGEVVACYDGGLKWLNGKTGEVLSDHNFVGGGDLLFSADGKYLLDICHKENLDSVNPGVRIYEGFELKAVVDCEPGTADSWRRENVQAKISADGSLLAVLCADGVVRAFGVTDEKQVYSVPANGATDLFFAAGNRLVLACNERLIFVEPSGDVLIQHELKELPDEDPLSETLAAGDLRAFVDGEDWGYATGGVIVAQSDPENRVQAVVGHQKAVPPSLVGAVVYKTLESAVAANPKSFSKSVRDLVKKTKTKSKSKAKVFPTPNTSSVREVEDYLLAQLDTQNPSYCSPYRAEVAVTRVLAGDIEGARLALNNCGPDFGTGLNLAHVAAYAAIKGYSEYAQELKKQSLSCATDGHPSTIKCRDNFLAVMAHALGEKSPPKIALKFEEGEYQIQERMADAAVALLLVGDTKEAFAQIQSSTAAMWWHHLSEFICLLFQSDDLQVFKDFVTEFEGSEHIQHFEVMARLVDRLMELDAHEEALNALATFPKLSFSSEVIRIVHAVARLGDLNRFEALAKMVQDKYADSPAIMAELLAAHNSFSPEDSEKRIVDFLTKMNPNDLNRWSLPGMVRGLVAAFRQAGLALDPVLGVAQALDGSHWAVIWAALPDGHDFEPEAQARTLKSYDYMGSPEAFRALLSSPERFEKLFAHALESAGRDRYNLGYLVGSMCTVGDFPRANIARMKISKSSRAMANEAMIYPLMKAGEFTQALQLADELDHGFGSCGREYTVMRGLVRGPWGSGGRTSHVM